MAPVGGDFCRAEVPGSSSSNWQLVGREVLGGPEGPMGSMGNLVHHRTHRDSPLFAFDECGDKKGLVGYHQALG